MNRYCELNILEKAGEIKDLVLQPTFVLQEGFRDDAGKKWRPITYTGDFQYINKDEKTIVEDVKGMKTDVFKIKEKLFRCKYPNIELVLINLK